MNPKYIFNTERVYLRLGRDYFNQEIRSIRPLFNLTAKCVGQDDEGKPLCSFVDKTNKWFIYEGRTKNYIVKKTNEYLSQKIIKKIIDANDKNSTLYKDCTQLKDIISKLQTKHP